MDKVIELAKQVGVDVGSGRFTYDELEMSTDQLVEIYTLARADLEAERERRKEQFASAEFAVNALKAERERLKDHLRWALSNINCEPYEWSDEENADAHRAARAALGE